MISTIELKKYVVGNDILGVIVGKLHYEKKLCLIILLKVDKNSKVNFYYTILPLSLAIYLQVEDGRKSLLDIKEIV